MCPPKISLFVPKRKLKKRNGSCSDGSGKSESAEKGTKTETPHPDLPSLGSTAVSEILKVFRQWILWLSRYSDL